MANKFNSWKPFGFSFRRFLSIAYNLNWCWFLRHWTETNNNNNNKKKLFPLSLIWFDIFIRFLSWNSFLCWIFGVYLFVRFSHIFIATNADKLNFLWDSLFKTPSNGIPLQNNTSFILYSNCIHAYLSVYCYRLKRFVFNNDVVSWDIHVICLFTRNNNGFGNNCKGQTIFVKWRL